MTQTVLILDDDVQLTMQWSRALESAGYEVLVTHGASEALDVCSTNEVALCVVDFIVRENGAPTANGGVSFLGKLNATLRNNMKILGVSGMERGYPGLDAKEYLMTFGAKGFIAKPFSNDELVHEVSRMLSAK